ncbi:major facilitator superfamily domain-containing protein 12-like [Tachypleus tridentatus]|uniref:major facilitator superfamily domain-containing protein 12-like n=1 Tax=Tachypleus tridentatus TaxID=6853 RepID=UPI003FD33354
MENIPKLPWSQKLSYGVGHVLNDVTASLWFSYLIVYLQFVLCFNTSLAGLLLLVGQVSDAFSTILVGYESDTSVENCIYRKYGRRKTLHLLGTLCVIISFPFIFTKCPGCENASEWAVFIFLAPFVVIFQFGWACTQVSHLALIPTITFNDSDREFLNILRYSFDVIADIMVYVGVMVVFETMSNGSTDGLSITRDDSLKFTVISFLLVGLGIVFSVIFHIGVKENQPHHNETTRKTPEMFGSLKWTYWLKNKHFYQVAVLYTTARMFQNFVAVFIPLYLQGSLGLSQDFLAKIPLVMNLSGFLASWLLRLLFNFCGKKVSYLIGTFLGMTACTWIYIGQGTQYSTQEIYGVALLLGAASSIVVICSLSFVPDLVGTNVENGALVYGFISFCDKLANGVGILFVQHLHSLMCNNCTWFYKNTLCYGVGGITVFSAVVLLMMIPVQLKAKVKKEAFQIVYGDNPDKPYGYENQSEKDPLLRTCEERKV